MIKSGLFEQAQNLPKIPKVVQELIASFNDQDSDIGDIAKKIELDQVIAAKVLRLANSSYYGGNRDVSSINDASVLLGIDALRTLVLASGVCGAFKEIPTINLQRFWQGSFLTACIAKTIGKMSKQQADVAFTCGMLHKIGELFIHINEPEFAQNVEKQVDAGANRIEIQRQTFGYDYVEVGAAFADFWKFPLHISQAIGYQLTPFETDNVTAMILNVSVYLSEKLNNRVGIQAIEKDFPEEAAARLGITWNDISGELEDIKTQREEFNRILTES